MAFFGNFEWDEAKSASNHSKHGISFLKATEMWNDQDLVQLRSLRDEFDETRFLVIAKIDSILWSAVITFREHRIRIISVRRSRHSEVSIYEKA